MTLQIYDYFLYFRQLKELILFFCFVEGVFVSCFTVSFTST